MNIVILGAGVAGVASAIALRLHGHTVRVVERRPAPSHLGAGVVLWPNASFVLAELGLLAAVAAVAGTPIQMKRMSQQGELLSTLDIGELDRAMGWPSHAILRRDLQRIMLARLADLGVHVEYGRHVLRLEDGGAAQARAVLDDGGELSADLIVGADGRMRSAAREYVNVSAAPVYQGHVNWVGVLESNAAVVDDMAILDFWGVGQRFGLVPVSRNKVYWAAAMAQPAPAGAAGHDVDIRAALSAQFAAWPAPVGHILAASDPASIRRIDIYDVDPIDCWHRDNVLLVGDAAHAALPTSGQGAGQALEDAWHLARCLPANLPTNLPAKAVEAAELPAALAAFTALRRDKTRVITQMARQLSGALFHTDPAAALERNRLARAGDSVAMVQAMARGWGAGLDLHRL
jgi:FAD-dependent urate hydroxylase